MTKMEEYAGEVESRTNRETRTTMVLIDREKGGDWIDASTRWIVLCDEHGSLLDLDTRSTASYFLAHPSEFCTSCDEMVTGIPHR